MCKNARRKPHKKHSSSNCSPLSSQSLIFCSTAFHVWIITFALLLLGNVSKSSTLPPLACLWSLASLLHWALALVLPLPWLWSLALPLPWALALALPFPWPLALLWPLLCLLDSLALHFSMLLCFAMVLCTKSAK